jgi:hypothetical protein
MKDLIEENITDKENITTLIELYYPVMFDKKIINISKYNETHSALLKSSKKIYDSNVKYYDNMNKFTQGIPPLDITGDIPITGITSLIMKCSMYSTKYQILPLDYIFKSINASKKFPFIKYGTSPKHEHLIRLYIMDDGQPMLKKSDVNKLLVILKKTTGISVYVNMLLPENHNREEYDKHTLVLFELSDTGKIRISFDNLKTMPVRPEGCIHEIIRLLNEFINQINECLINYDFKLLPIPDIDIIDNPRIQIIKINYSEIYNATSFQPYIPNIKRPIIPAIFYPINTDIKKKDLKITTDIKYLYTRVSNFNIDQEFNEITTPYSEVSFNINTRKLCISINNLSSVVYIPILQEYISRYVTLMNDTALLKIFKSDGILKYNVPVEEQYQVIEAPLDMANDIEEFENSDIDEDNDNNDFLNKLLTVQQLDINRPLNGVDDTMDDLVPVKNDDIGDKEEDEDEDDDELNNFDFDDELGEI